ncbi:uncharacterized protein LOC133903398 isoform X2 [Phragmites australis]|uniref:uncharacterized protein LOC133903398 isoform X2 n=1 Tax=Phragmites australis TaxID=29695 RepID=UPI002D77BBF9|nr:uncharacterized protein LOC133903398 isoform X2 [Phragmites australis]
MARRGVTAVGPALLPRLRLQGFPLLKLKLFLSKHCLYMRSLFHIVNWKKKTPLPVIETAFGCFLLRLQETRTDLRNVTCYQLKQSTEENKGSLLKYKGISGPNWLCDWIM